jgi:hypothetical protein
MAVTAGNVLEQYAHPLQHSRVTRVERQIPNLLADRGEREVQPLRFCRRRFETKAFVWAIVLGIHIKAETRENIADICNPVAVAVIRKGIGIRSARTA